MMTSFYRSNSIVINDNKDVLILPSEDALENILKKKKHVEFQKPNKNLKFVWDELNEETEDKSKFKKILANQNDEIARLKMLNKNLEIENHRLNNNSSLHDKPKNNSFIIPPLNGYELKSQEALKSQLLKKNAELNIYKEKVLELQCKLIETKDGELSYLGESKEHGRCARLEQQLSERKSKLRALENAYRTQDKVIEKFEEIFRKQLLHSSIEKTNSDLKIIDSLLNENRDLKLQLNKFKDLPASVNQSFDENNSEADMTTLRRFEIMERRAQILEKQMTENARIWAREKAEMQLKLQELKQK